MRYLAWFALPLCAALLTACLLPAWWLCWPCALAALLLLVIVRLRRSERCCKGILLFCGAAAGAMALYHFLLRRRLPGGELLWYLLAILLGVAYLLLTALPLTGGIFLDPRDAAAMATIPY